MSTAPELQKSLINASRSEVSDMTFPLEFSGVDWSDREIFGWRDRKAPLRGYLYFPEHTDRQTTEPKVVGILLKAAESRMSAGRDAMCLLCGTIRKASEITLFTARRTGPAGRNGSTVGTYICADLSCSQLIRIPPLPTAIRPDPEWVVQERIENLRVKAAAFIEDVPQARLMFVIPADHYVVS